MRTAAFPLPRGEYTDETRPWSMQEMFNLRYQAAETIGTRSPEKLQTLPGLKPWVEVSDSGRVRGLHNAEGKLLSVMNDTLYRISNAGVAIPIGSIPGSGRVQIDHNQISLGNEVVAVNGSAGYLWNTVTDAFGRITDAGFPGASSVRFVSGYFVVIEPQGRFAASSAPAQGLEWNTFDRWTSEVSPDPLVAMGVRGNELLLLSTTSGEFFQATPNVRQPFRTKQINFKNVGAAGPHVTFDADGNIFWLGNDGVFYNLNGYSPARISTRMQEDAIKGLDWSRAFAFRWDTVLYWTFPDGITLGWDFAQRQWHRRGSTDMTRWRPNAMVRWNNRWVAGDFQAARLYDCNLEDNYWLEGSETYLTRFSLPVVSDNGNALRLPRLELRMDTGQTPTVAIPFPAQPGGPTITGPATFSLWEDEEFDLQYEATGGTAPYTFSIGPGTTAPADGEMSGGGHLTGPAEVGESTFRVRVTDANGLRDEMDVEGEVKREFLLSILNDGADDGVGVFRTTATGLVYVSFAKPAVSGNLRSVIATTAGDYAVAVGSAGLFVFSVTPEGVVAYVGPAPVQPGVEVFYGAFSPDDTLFVASFLAASGGTYAKAYTFEDGALALAPALSPAVPAACRQAAWSSDGLYCTIPINDAAYEFKVYKRAGDTLTALADPLPGGVTRREGSAAIFTPFDNQFIVAHENSASPRIHVFANNFDDTFTYEAGEFDVEPDSYVRQFAVSPDGEQIAMAIDAAAYGQVYDYIGIRVGEDFQFVQDLPIAAGTAQMFAITFARNGNMLIGSRAGDDLYVWTFDGSDWVQQPNVTDPTGKPIQLNYSLSLCPRPN